MSVYYNPSPTVHLLTKSLHHDGFLPTRVDLRNVVDEEFIIGLEGVLLIGLREISSGIVVSLIPKSELILGFSLLAFPSLVPS